jgi:glycine betaine/choline ABC-type transport system substrate-binding protein
MTRQAIRRLLGALLLAGALTLAACGESTDEETSAGAGSAQPQGTKVRITLGTQGFPEALILGELWRQALAANGYAVVLRKNIGPAGDLDQALRDGEIDGHVAYTGTVLSVVARDDVTGLGPEETYRRVKAFYAGRDMATSAMTPFENVDAIATTSTFAQEQRLREIGDLRRLDSFTLGARPEFESLFIGLEGLQEVYDLTNAEFKPIALGAQYTALDEGDVDAANVFTTDAELADGDYELLEDPEKLFGSQNVVMVVDDGKLERIGRDNFLRVVDEVNARLTDDAILEMNAAVSGGQDEADVARRFLNDAGLLRGA